MKKHPYKEVIDLKEERKEFALLWSGKSKKYEQYSDWENHIKEQLSCFSSPQELYNFKHYCINVSRSQEKAPDMYLSYVGLLIPIYLDTIFDGMPKLLTLLLFIAVLFYAIVQNKKMATESYVFRDIISIIDKVEGTIEFGQSSPQRQRKGESMKKEKTKNFIKKPFLWLVVIELLAAIILFLCGFRISYAPALENSWDAIAACASWAGVLASLAAILVAVRIPKVIADRQDKIALFEKRFAFYDVLSRCVSFSQIIGNIQTNQEIQVFFIAAFGRAQMSGYTQDSLNRDVLKLKNEAMAILKQGVFLFDTAEQVKPLITSLGSLLFIPEDHDRFWECYSDYMNAVKGAEEILLPKVEQSISIGK